MSTALEKRGARSRKHNSGSHPEAPKVVREVQNLHVCAEGFKAKRLGVPPSDPKVQSKY